MSENTTYKWAVMLFFMLSIGTGMGMVTGPRDFVQWVWLVITFTISVVGMFHMVFFYEKGEEE